MLHARGQPRKPSLVACFPQLVFAPEQAGVVGGVDERHRIALQIPQRCLRVAKVQIVDEFGMQRVGGIEQTVLEAKLEPGVGVAFRSEEQTSELQSLMGISYAAFCSTKQ